MTGQTITVQIRPPRTPLRGQKGSRIRVTKLQKLAFRIYLMHDGVEEVRNYEFKQYDIVKSGVVQIIYTTSVQ